MADYQPSLIGDARKAMTRRISYAAFSSFSGHSAKAANPRREISAAPHLV